MSTTIDVSPLEIGRTVERGKQAQETLTVGNVSEERYAYRVEPAAAYRGWVDPDPDLFAINGQAERAVAITLQPPEDAKIGIHTFDLAVVNDDLEDDQETVKVTLRVPIPLWWWVLIALVIIILLVLLIWWAQPGAERLFVPG